MSPESQLIAIGTFNGYANIQRRHRRGDEYFDPLIGQPYNFKGYDKDIWPIIPHYLEDKNAMDRVEQLLNDAQYRSYLAWRHILSHNLMHEAVNAVQEAVFTLQQIIAMDKVTVEQRAEALLRALNLWDDSK